jgi:DNA-binding NarL/FixJ family response regulator
MPESEAVIIAALAMGLGYPEAGAAMRYVWDSRRRGNAPVNGIDVLERGRESYARSRWADAYESLSLADQAAALGAEDLTLLATSAYMLGRDDDFVELLERAHHVHLDAGETPAAVRCAFWVGLKLVLGGEMSRATGWFGRAQRLLEREERDCVERGYLLIPTLLQQVASGDCEAAYATAAEAARIGERFGDADLLAMAGHEQGFALFRQGRADEGLRLVDEAMIAATAGELSPIVTGLVYCSVIAGCQELFELRRAREWTVALTDWCREQPDMVAHTGQCLVHRAEIMQLHGSWQEALHEAQRAGLRFAQSSSQVFAAHAVYRQGEVHRLRGEFEAAEAAYREASRGGWEPQPGLALLRLAQGRADAAAAAIRRVVGGAKDGLERAALLPAQVEIMLAVGDMAEASNASRDLDEIAEERPSGVLGAMSAHARGAVSLAAGDAGTASVALRHARQVWQELEAPYETARVRELVGLACRALGDEDSATLELDAARGVFEQLGAAPDLARVDSLLAKARGDTHGLTERELEVLRLVAAGKSNREISAALVISEHTVARHMQNIFAKLNVSSRTAASAFAFGHDLV